jgi:hypothetical protein
MKSFGETIYQSSVLWYVLNGTEVSFRKSAMGWWGRKRERIWMTDETVYLISPNLFRMKVNESIMGTLPN